MLALLSVLIIQGPFRDVFADGTMNRTFKNKYHWEITVPECWIAEGIEGISANDSPGVIFRPGELCPGNSTLKRTISISTILGVNMTAAEDRVASKVQIARLRGYEFHTGHFKVGSKKIPTYETITKGYPHAPKSRNMIAFTTCDGKNTSISYNYELSQEQKTMALKDLEILPDLEKIISSFVCHKP